jgi:hypothetical protein
MTINTTIIPALITIRPTCFGTVDRLNRVNRLGTAFGSILSTGQQTFLLSEASKPDLGPTRLLFSRYQKYGYRGFKLTKSPLSSAVVKNK